MSRIGGGEQTVIGLVPRLDGLGGPTSFNAKFRAGLQARGLRVTHDLDDPAVQAVLINGGTRRLGSLLRARRRGVRLVQRLDGMNWTHRLRWPGAKHYLRSEANNALLAFIRRRVAHAVVYQSQFTQGWWERVYGPAQYPNRVVHNAVDLAAYSPEGPERPPDDHVRVLMVEGHIGGGNEQALHNALGFTRALGAQCGRPVELRVVGDVPAALRSLAQDVWVDWAGIVPREAIPGLQRSAHLFFSAELNAPCPNAVIEALACGSPVVAFATGALRELVEGDAGCLAPYGSNVWRLETPVFEPLARGALRLFENLPHHRRAARALAEERYGLDRMIDGYLEALL